MRLIELLFCFEFGSWIVVYQVLDWFFCRSFLGVNKFIFLEVYVFGQVLISLKVGVEMVNVVNGFRGCGLGFGVTGVLFGFVDGQSIFRFFITGQCQFFIKIEFFFRFFNGVYMVLRGCGQVVKGFGVVFVFLFCGFRIVGRV